MSENNHEGMKKCTKCGEWKPATAEYFHRDKTRGCGLIAMCKECKGEYNHEYRQKNKDSIREYDREYYQKNKDHYQEYDRERRQKNKDRIREYNREYRHTPVGRLVRSVVYLRQKTGATIYVRDMTEEQKETLANQYVAVRTLEKTEKELLAASGKKRCSKCGGVFDYDMFYKSDGRYKSVCRECVATSQRKYRQNKKKHLTKQNLSPIMGSR